MTTVHGYASRFNEIVRPANGGAAHLIEPGAFVLPGDPGGAYSIDLFHHEIRRESNGGLCCVAKHRVGSTADGSLRFEQNDQGLYFEWTPGPDDAARRALDAIAEWRLNGACLTVLGSPWSAGRIETMGGEAVQIFETAYIGGLALTVGGCCPATGCKVMTGPRIPGDPDLRGERRTFTVARAA